MKRHSRDAPTRSQYDSLAQVQPRYFFMMETVDHSHKKSQLLFISQHYYGSQFISIRRAYFVFCPHIFLRPKQSRSTAIVHPPSRTGRREFFIRHKGQTDWNKLRLSRPSRTRCRRINMLGCLPVEYPLHRLRPLHQLLPARCRATSSTTSGQAPHDYIDHF
jgi:hypothetical protein